jgi:hypothetical protein
MQSLKIAHLNCRSYLNNRTAIETLILNHDYDLILLTETWLKKSIKLPSKKYNCFDALSSTGHK